MMQPAVLTFPILAGIVLDTMPEVEIACTEGSRIYLFRKERS
jgi:hypothetical protein